MPSKKIFDIFPPKRIQKPELKKSFQKKQERKRKIGFSFSNPLRNILFFILILIFVLLIFLSLSAKAEINIIPQTEKVFSKDNFSVDTNVSDLNFLEKVMPGFFFSKEKEITKEFKATGITGKKGKASGMIKVYNNYHLSQTLVATTRFVSADGKLFRSKEDIVIPAESTADVYVEAAEPGPDYNIKPSTFSIPGLLGSPRYTAVYGKSFSDMKGGLVGNLPQITKQDLENAEKELLEILTDLLKQELEKEAGESILLLDDAISKEVLESSCTRDELEEVEGFECTLYLKCKALGFLKADLEDFAKQSLLKEISESKSIKKDSLKIESVVKSINFETRKLFLDTNMEAEIFLDIDVNLLKEVLKGKSLTESRILLDSLDEIEEVKIGIFPFWIQRIPQDSNRININLKSD